MYAYKVSKENNTPIYFSSKKKAVDFIEFSIGHKTVGLQDLTKKNIYNDYWVSNEKTINQILYGKKSLVDILVFEGSNSGYYFGLWHIERIIIN